MLVPCWALGKAIAGVTKAAKERAKKNLVNNPKLRDCQIHLNDPQTHLLLEILDGGGKEKALFVPWVPV